VNRSNFIILGQGEFIELAPVTEVHQRMFNILLVEFFSSSYKLVLGLDKIVEEKKRYGYLGYLETVYLDPKINVRKQTELKESVKNFISWLDKEFIVEKVWFSSIEVELDLKISRIDFIKICGDISKHGFIRLDKRIQDIKRILNNNSLSVSDEQAYLVLPEFYEWFHKDIFNYHVNTIAEFLNNINWSIHEYLDVLRKESAPDKSLTLVAKSMYFDLKSFVPYLPRFKVADTLKKRY
jgi:hypothetical protein